MICGRKGEKSMNYEQLRQAFEFLEAEGVVAITLQTMSDVEMDLVKKYIEDRVAVVKRSDSCWELIAHSRRRVYFEVIDYTGSQVNRPFAQSFLVEPLLPVESYSYF